MEQGVVSISDVVPGDVIAWFRIPTLVVAHEHTSDIRSHCLTLLNEEGITLQRTYGSGSTFKKLVP